MQGPSERVTSSTRSIPKEKAPSTSSNPEQARAGETKKKTQLSVLLTAPATLLNMVDSFLSTPETPSPRPRSPHNAAERARLRFELIDTDKKQKEGS